MLEKALTYIALSFGSSFLVSLVTVSLVFPVQIQPSAKDHHVSYGQGLPLATSSDVWASVITNVVPLMALIGDRNTREFLRMTSTYGHLLLLAAAPLGILSVMVSAIRLCGYHFLKRLIGRDSDRRGEALVELTPLSTAPASSVFTTHAVEIELSEQTERLAFVCAHVKRTDRVSEALLAFKYLIKKMDGKAELDRDYELVLGITDSALSEDEMGELVNSLTDVIQDEIDELFASRIGHASISFRMTGISPTQTADQYANATAQYRPVDVIVSIIFIFAMCALQIGAFYIHGSRYDASNVQTLVMGLVGYGGIVGFTFAILVLIKGEVTVKQLELLQIFSNAV